MSLLCEQDCQKDSFQSDKDAKVKLTLTLNDLELIHIALNDQFWTTKDKEYSKLADEILELIEEEIEAQREDV